MSGRSSCGLAGAALVLSLLSPGEAVAQVAIGADASAMHGGTNAAWGFGIDGRFGYRTGFPRAWIVHSIIVQAEAIGGIRQLLAQPDDLDIKTLGGGLRIGGALKLVPALRLRAFQRRERPGRLGVSRRLRGSAGLAPSHAQRRRAVRA